MMNPSIDPFGEGIDTREQKEAFVTRLTDLHAKKAPRSHEQTGV